MSTLTITVDLANPDKDAIANAIALLEGLRGHKPAKSTSTKRTAKKAPAKVASTEDPEEAREVLRVKMRPLLKVAKNKTLLRAKLKELGASGITNLAPENFAAFSDYIDTL